jgi:prepilin peptidase CpaA
MHYLAPVLQALLVLVVVTAALFDIRERRIPNWVTVSGVVAGLVLNGFLYEWPGLMSSLKGLGLALLIYFPLFAIRAMGAGDAKLMAAVGSITGPANWLGIFILTAMIGGFLGIALLLLTGRTRRTVANVGFLIRELAYLRPPYLGKEELDIRNPRSVGLPHGAVIALGVIVFLVSAAIWAPRM